MLNKTRSLIGLDSTTEMELLCFLKYFGLYYFTETKSPTFFNIE